MSAVTYVGETDLAGVTVRHYRGTSDIGRAARRASAASRGALTAAANGFRTDTVPFDAYLDEQGRLRKVRHRFSFANEGETREVVSTTLLYGFGVTVSVPLPDARDIYTGEIEQGRAAELRTGPGPDPGRPRAVPRHPVAVKWSVRAMRGVRRGPYPGKSATAVRGE